MSGKHKVPQKFQIWIEVRKRYHLSDAHIQMARELGMNPKKFGSLANSQQEPWKMPLSEFIEECYHKRFNRSRPEKVVSIEEKIKTIQIKREEKRKAKAENNHPEIITNTATP